MATAVLVQRHPIIWRDPPPWPFLWRGLLPLAALGIVTLYALGPLARYGVQAEVEGELRAQLNAAGFSWVTLAVSGQSVHLSGTEPEAGAGSRALELARSATCPTWLGRHRCATSVAGTFQPPPPPSPAAVPDETAAPPYPAPLAAPMTREGCEHAFASLLASEQVEFASGSARIDPRSNALLDQLARQARGCPGKIRIEGYTDTVGRGRVNQRLSNERAQAVRAALVARGIPSQRLSAKGYGARRAIAPNDTEAGRARNRRIELHIISTK
ncbi:MAG TPA: OmpA family protein [Steroidobacteraceae bacterium]|nr:OmpA family protein [Steroidobacteraceae bacterium]